jgi:sugar/nucleoside kinase (ribokinase family)
MKYDVITFGSATVDIFIEPRQERIVELETEDGIENLVAYPSGGKILIERPHIEIGGGGTNAAATFARLGMRVAFGGGSGMTTMEGMCWPRSPRITLPLSGTDAAPRPT